MPEAAKLTAQRVALIVAGILATAVVTAAAVITAIGTLLGPAFREQTTQIAKMVVQERPVHPSAAQKADIAYIREQLADIKQSVATQESLDMLRRELQLLTDRVGRLEER